MLIGDEMLINGYIELELSDIQHEITQGLELL